MLLARLALGWRTLVLVAVGASSLQATPSMARQRWGVADGYAVRPVSFDRVTLEDDFWLPRLRTQRRVLVPHALERTAEALADLETAGEVLAGKPPVSLPAPHRFRTSDLFKVVEGAAYLLAIDRDPTLESQIDHIARIIAAAQEPDGYLGATRTLYPHLAIDMMGDGRYTYLDHSHELYIVGHLYEAAVAYYHATGKRELLDVADRNARHVRHVFFEGDPAYNDGKPILRAPGHEEIELALVRLAEATGDPLHLDTAKRFLDIRGVTYVPSGEGVNSPSYAQQHQPVAEQRKPAGHAVRATYLYAGMADVGAKLSDNRYNAALDAIWADIVDTRMHLTGGLGAVHGIEGFGDEYELPNADAFDETCAGVGAVLFNWRMFLLHHDAKFLDVAEVALYNNTLAGVNLGGDRFFYVNPLAADGFRPFNHGHAGRAPWFGTACCPTNLARLIPQVPGMMFAQDDEGLLVCLYASGRATMTLGGVETEVVEETGYPFDGDVSLTIRPEKPARFAVRLRAPTWATDRFVPGQLYRYASTEAPLVRVLVNDSPVDVTAAPDGFVTVEREWSAGDRVRLELPMPVRFNRCREEVEANRGRVAVTRGPLVYCAEGTDNAAHTSAYMIPSGSASGGKVAPLAINGHTTRAITVAAERLAEDGEVQSAPLRLVPYYAWNNRGVGSMAVWLPDNAETLRASALVIDDNAKRFTSAEASHTFAGDTTTALVDGLLPSDSFDTSIPRWTSWPERGKPQSLDFELTHPTLIRSVEVYWYDDHGGVQTPDRWELEVQNDTGEWRPFPLYNTDTYGVAPDQFNIVHPAEPLTAQRLRMRVWPKPDAAAGVLEFVVRPELAP